MTARVAPDRQSDMNSRLALSFDGAACKGAMHVGVARWVYEQGVRPMAFAGSSSGAIVAAACALGHDRHLVDWWLAVTGSRVFRPGAVLSGRWPFRMSEIVGDALRARIGDARMCDVEYPLGVVVSVRRGTWLEPRWITHRDDLPIVDVLLASCFIPGPYHEAIRLEDRIGLDGGFTVAVPTRRLADLGAESAILSCARATPPPHVDGVALHPVRPVASIPVGYFDFDRERTTATMELGRESAAHHLTAEIFGAPTHPT